MKRVVMSDREIYNTLYEAGYWIRFIDGKWFINGVEYPLDGVKGLKRIIERRLPMVFYNVNIINKWIEWFITMESENGEKWPELPILLDAKERLAAGQEPWLAYPLTHKELEIINYLLVGDPKDTYAIFFYGVGGSGKSTVCKIITSIFGKTNVCSLGFNELGDKFRKAELAGKRLWYDDDICPIWSEHNTGTLKKIITHATDLFEHKFQSPYEAQYRVKPLFCCNVAPKFDITDSGLLRRILYYSKNEKIQNPDGSLANKEWSYEELVNIVMAALQTPFNAKDFEDETHDIIMKTNSVAKWGMDVDYDIYCERCQENRVMPFGKEKMEMLRSMFEKWKLKN